MKIWTSIVEFFTPVDTTKSEMAIYEYWKEDRKIKIAEARITNYSPDHYATEADKVKKSLEDMSATDIQIYAEGRTGPQIMFKIDDKEYITSEILDFTYENIMVKINNVVNESCF